MQAALPELGVGGTALWAAVVPLREWGPGDLVLLEEACRIKDRLDKLDRLHRGDDDVWARVYSRGGDEPVELHVDEALSEARQQASVLRQLIGQLNLPPATDKRGASVDPLDDLLAKRRKREADRVAAAKAEVGAAVRPE